MGVEMTGANRDRARLADFIAREIVRLNTPELPRFASPERAPYAVHDIGLSGAEFTRCGETIQ